MHKITKYLKKAAAFSLAAIIGCSVVPAMQTEAGGAIKKGIDVSMHNGSVNWNEVAGDGYSFAFIKIGSTKSGVDPRFEANLSGAQAAGLATGVYLYSYATSPEEAAAEANMVLGWLNGRGLSYPVVYDIEDPTAMNGKSKEELAAMVNAFCSTIQAGGYHPMVYASTNWFTNRIGSVGYDKWVAQYASACTYGGSNIAFWQATSNGSVSGINGRVDINYQYKDFGAPAAAEEQVLSDGFMEQDGNTYYVQDGEIMKDYFIQADDVKYYADPEGKIIKNTWYTRENSRYYMREDGSIVTGEAQIAEWWYYFNEDGAMCMEWVDTPTGRHYYEIGSGIMQKNVDVTIDDVAYQFDDSGNATVIE